MKENPQNAARRLIIAALTKTHNDPARAFRIAYENAKDGATREQVEKIAGAFKIPPEKIKY